MISPFPFAVLFLFFLALDNAFAAMSCSMAFLVIMGSGIGERGLGTERWGEEGSKGEGELGGKGDGSSGVLASPEGEASSSSSGSEGWSGKRKVTVRESKAVRGVSDDGDEGSVGTMGSKKAWANKVSRGEGELGRRGEKEPKKSQTS